MKNTLFTAPIAEQIWDKKYRHKEADGTPIDQDVTDTWDRIATDLSRNEPERGVEFYGALKDFKYLPAGRIASGAGTGRAVTLFNCFVMGTVPDSMGGIFDMLKEAALTMQQGGGIGYDFSTIRPKGCEVKGVAADASGPLSFMDVWDAMCRTIMSAGERRGAMMATMRCDHPDVMDFITAKKDATRLRMFNLSVLVTDEFMRCVKEDKPWNFVWKGEHYGERIRARDLWDAILQSTYKQAEPGVIFIDRINAANNLNYVETIAATNPCGEQPLPPYGACLLGSINLARLVTNPFDARSHIDTKELQKLVATAVRMMDNVVDVSNFPLPQQREEAQNKRRIGLGVTGLADALVMMGLTYGSKYAVDFTEHTMKIIAHAAYSASVELAKEKGAFPLFDAEKYLAKGTAASTLDQDLQDEIREHGIRNALLTSIAPTGTISLYAGNVSSGIEPIFANSYTRKILNGDGTHRFETIEDYAVQMYRELWENDVSNSGMKWSDERLPDYFVSAQTLTPSDHVRMQAAAQKWVDSSISKTINCPEDITYEDFKNVYMEAWDSGCKGCTTYRPNDVTGSVLFIEPTPTAEPVAQVTTKAEKRADVLQGETYKIKFGSEVHALYVTINHTVDDIGNARPFEIFLNTKNPSHHIWTMALTRMISAVFRVSDDSRFVVDELKEVFDPKGGAWVRGSYVASIVAEIGNVIERHMVQIGYVQAIDTKPAVNAAAGDVCPSCGSSDFKNEGGCETCISCGHSKCG
jgi:ribonucleoside-diphosphate reductase alpha chain